MQENFRGVQNLKITIFSDTHGYTKSMLKAINLENPNAIIHLGDCTIDCEDIRENFPDIPLYSVKGNCDFISRVPDKETATIFGIKCFLTHGHKQNVKTGLMPLLNAAYFSEAKLVCYGHTHRAHCEEIRGMLVVNPGACGLGGGSYARVIINHEGEIDCEIVYI